MKAFIAAFLDHLNTYDYLLFAAAVLLFLLFIILAILVRKKTLFALLFVLLSVSSLLLLPTLGYFKLHEYLYKNKVTVDLVKKLEFSDLLIVTGELSNISKHRFKACDLSAGVYKVAHQKILDAIYPFSPFRKKVLNLENIDRNSSVKYKIIFADFHYSKDYNVSIKAVCR